MLTAACAKCHLFKNAAQAPVAAAQPVLVRSTFVHAPHLLQADCLRCHPGITKSSKSADLNFEGVALCQECHRRGEVRQECTACHRYHPPVRP